MSLIRSSWALDLTAWSLIFSCIYMYYGNLQIKRECPETTGGVQILFESIVEIGNTFIFVAEINGALREFSIALS